MLFLFLFLKEVIREDSCIIIIASVFIDLARGTVKGLKVFLHVFIDFHDGSHISASVAIVRCRPDSDQRLIKHPPEPIELQLVCPADKVKPIFGQERLDGLCSKEVPSTACRLLEAVHSIWVGPEEVSDGPVFRDLLAPVEGPDLVE